jgi:hypothetical protein
VRARLGNAAMTAVVVVGGVLVVHRGSSAARLGS